MKPTLITVLLFNFACVSRVLSSGSTHHDEGLPISNRDLDAVVAAGCGQTPSSNGNNNCTYGNLTPCAENGQFPHFSCANPGAEVGQCWGAQDETCQGDIVRNGSLCLNLGPVSPCCSLNSECKTVPVVFTLPNGQQFAGTSCSTGARQWPIQNTRKSTSVSPDDICKPILY